MGTGSSKPKSKPKSNAPLSFYSITPPSPSLPPLSSPTPSPNARIVALRSYLQELKEKVSNTHPNYTGLKAALNNANNNGKINGLFKSTLNDYVSSLIKKKDPALLLDLLQTVPEYENDIKNSILHTLDTLLLHPTDNETSFIFLKAFPDLISITTPAGQTLLHTAARKANREAIVLLLRLGGPDIVNKKDSEGRTPYGVAESIDTQAMLVSYGANPINKYDRELLNTFTGKVVLDQSNEVTIATFRKFIVDQLIAFIQKHTKKVEVSNNMLNKNKTRRFLAPLYKTNSDQGSLVMAISTYFLEDPFYTRCLRTYSLNKYKKPQGSLRNCVINTLTAIIHKSNYKELKPSTIKLFFDNLAKLYFYIPEDFRNHPEQKLNLNIQDKNGRTMLHWAIVTQNLEMIILLRQFGADCEVSDNYNRICTDYILDIPSDIKQLLHDNNRPFEISESNRGKIQEALDTPSVFDIFRRAGGGTRSKRRNRSKTKRHPRK